MHYSITMGSLIWLVLGQTRSQWEGRGARTPTKSLSPTETHGTIKPGIFQGI